MKIIYCRVCGRQCIVDNPFENILLCEACDSLNNVNEITISVNEINDSNSTVNEEVFENGELVVIADKQHVWDGEIAIVRGDRFKFCRLELKGFKIWFPKNCLKRIEE